MEREKIVTLIQPVDVREEQGVHILKYVKTDPDVIRNTLFLEDTVRAFELPTGDSAKRRYILDTPNRDSALRAAAALLSLTAARDSAPDEDGDETLDMLLWNEDSETDGSSYDCHIVRQEELAERDEHEFPFLMAVFPKGQENNVSREVSDADFLFVECGAQIDRKFFDILEHLTSRMVMLWVRDVSTCRTELEQLMFGQGFCVINVQKPEDDYYVRLMSGYLELCGYKTDDTVEPCGLVRRLFQYRNQYFETEDLFRYVDRAVSEMKKRETEILSDRDFLLPCICEKEEPEKRLDKMIGLHDVKRQIRKAYAERIVRTRMGQGASPVTGYNLAFAGPPGTGKSVVAALYAEILAKERVTSGAFVNASRSDIIGEYLGHTAPKIKKLFDNADGGVLFVDEAGGMIGHDDFTREAVTEFVRFMEQRPQTTVIFATYPDKMEAFLDQDPGLRSRITRVIDFPSYTDEELLRIMRLMAENEGFEIEEGNDSFIRAFLGRMRQTAGENFGNAREVRRFLQTAFANSCLRTLEEEKTTGEKGVPVIRRADMEQAARELAQGKKPAHRMGFRMNEQDAITGKETCNADKR